MTVSYNRVHVRACTYYKVVVNSTSCSLCFPFRAVQPLPEPGDHYQSPDDAHGRSDNVYTGLDFGRSEVLTA